MLIKPNCMVRVSAVFALLLASLPAAAQFSPPDIAGLKLWLRADSAGSVLTSGTLDTLWKDVSGNSNNATASASSQPTFVASVPLLNNKPALLFNGSTSGLNGTVITGINDSSITTFILCNGNPQPGDHCAFFGIGAFGSTGVWLYDNYGEYSFNNQGNYMNAVNTMPLSGFNYAVWGMDMQSNISDTLYQNGTPVIWGGSSYAGNFTNGSYEVGYSSTGPGIPYFSGNIAEIIVYASALNHTQQSQVNNYLYNKYAPPVNLGPDIIETYKICPDTLQTGSRFVSYVWSTGDTGIGSLSVRKTGYYSVTVVDVFGR